MNAIKRWFALRYWRRRWSKPVCKNCVYLNGAECSRRRERVYYPELNSCGRIFTLYDAAKQRLHYDRYAKK